MDTVLNSTNLDEQLGQQATDTVLNQTNIDETVGEFGNSLGEALNQPNITDTVNQVGDVATDARDKVEEAVDCNCCTIS
jgi:hypothetical protein